MRPGKIENAEQQQKHRKGGEPHIPEKDLAAALCLRKYLLDLPFDVICGFQTPEPQEAECNFCKTARSDLSRCRWTWFTFGHLTSG